ncbi:hypothetical protein B2G71_00715 [Novosphingobium sp. PC22D]|uniref:CPBP family glutamic-type intramembrane protease n=1 Tax=Novosphingobium sp. PC22D TaxID=1962403 RepID=UPI000BF0532C|nr:CPBP family glutamic-type intramembrane protease [Novosphingobium sp. PC22D]PEQ14169.1 hypothetical protein B2G71_00715 [Novosphingobium sp. PC22D]
MITAMPIVLRAFLAFLRRPRLLEPSGLRAPGARADWLALLALHLGVLLLVVMPVYALWMKAFGLPAPDSFGQVDPVILPWIVVIAAPIAEEALFRGWQTGRPRALWLLGCAALAALAVLANVMGASAVLAGAVLLAAMVAAPIGWVALRRREAPRWFVAAFPAIFYLVVAAFAVVHVLNYPSATLLGLPLVLPQLWGALVLGYIRQRIGLVAAMLDHAVANAAVLALAMLGS